MIYAFGDESVTSDLVVYSAAVFSADCISQAEEILAIAKRDAGVSLGTPIHCRELFNEYARLKSPWKDVHPDNIHSMLQSLCKDLNAIQQQPIISLIEPAFLPPQPIAPGMPNRPLGDKGMATLGYYFVTTALLKNYERDGLKFIIDPDKTKIPWGLGNEQVNETRKRFYTDFGPGQEPQLFHPEIQNSPKPVLLEIADLYAYTVRHVYTLTGGRQTRRFQEFYKIIQPQEIRPGSFNPNSTWVKAGEKEQTSDDE